MLSPVEFERQQEMQPGDVHETLGYSDSLFRQGRKVLEREIDPFLAAPPSDLSTRILTLIKDMRVEWRSLDERIDALNDDLTQHARVDEAANRLTSIPGIGVLGATALVAAVGNGEAFRRARDMPAWLGLVPKQMTTGGKPRLLSITKRGNIYLRMLLIHGARAALPSLSKQATPLGEWLRALLSRAHRNVVIVALAAKLTRIAWATLRRGIGFDPEMGATVTT
jgi:transposase